MVDIIKDDGDKSVEIQTRETPSKVQVKGISRDAAFSIFNTFVERGYAASVKHLGGYFFVEVPVALRGDPCFGQEAEIANAARRAGLQTIQTGNTLRIIG